MTGVAYLLARRPPLPPPVLLETWLCFACDVTWLGVAGSPCWLCGHTPTETTT